MGSNLSLIAKSFEHSVLPRQYGSVLLVLVAAYGLNMYLAFSVGRARKKYDVKYPKMYSDNNDDFNCIQRAHQNYLEFIPFFVPSVAIVGLQFPRLATLSGVAFLVGRFLYAKGYQAENVKKRAPGFALSMLDIKKRAPGFALSMLGGMLPLLVTQTIMGFKLLKCNGI